MDNPLHLIDWPIHTQRLRLRALEATDAEATWEYRQLPEVTQWITSGPSDYATYLKQFLDSERFAKDVAVELVAEDGTARLIGTVMVRIDDAWAQTEIVDQARGLQAELGWSFHPEAGGKGYATEAVRTVLGLCFETLGIHRVIAECFAANEPSWRLMERLGMRREEYSLKSGLHRSGQWMDGMTYAMLAEEWPVR